MKLEFILNFKHVPWEFLGSRHHLSKQFVCARTILTIRNIWTLQQFSSDDVCSAIALWWAHMRQCASICTCQGSFSSACNCVVDISSTVRQQAPRDHGSYNQHLIHCAFQSVYESQPFCGLLQEGVGDKHAASCIPSEWARGCDYTIGSSWVSSNV